MGSWDGGVEVMFAVKEHAVGKKIDEAAALGAGMSWVFGVFAVMVDGPDGEESGETFADEHCAEVEGDGGSGRGVLEAEEDGQGNGGEFKCDPVPLAFGGEAPGGEMKAQRK